MKCVKLTRIWLKHQLVSYSLCQIPKHIWTNLSMDFITCLPHSQGKTVIFVVACRLSKFVHFIAMSHPYTAATVAQQFFINIFIQHGLPRSIVCDRNVIFLSEFWQQLFKLQGVSFNLSSAYHPKSDGQIEVINRTLEMYWRCFTSSRPKEWIKWLLRAEYCYNTSFHCTIKMTPHEAISGDLLFYPTGKELLVIQVRIQNFTVVIKSWKNCNKTSWKLKTEWRLKQKNIE